MVLVRRHTKAAAASPPPPPAVVDGGKAAHSPPTADGISIVGALFPALLLGFVILSMLLVGVVWPWRPMADTPPTISANVIAQMPSKAQSAVPLPQSLLARDGTTLRFNFYAPSKVPAPCTVLLLHSVGLSARVYHPLAEILAERCAVYAVDSRGHGSSDSARYWPGGIAYPAQLVDDVIDILKFLREERHVDTQTLHVVAHGTAASLVTRVELDRAVGVTFVAPLVSDSNNFVYPSALVGFLQVHRQRIIVLSLLSYVRISIFNVIPTAFVHLRHRSKPRGLTFIGLMAHCPSFYHSGRDSFVLFSVRNRKSFDMVLAADDTIVRPTTGTGEAKLYKQYPEASTHHVISNTDHITVLADPALAQSVLQRAVPAI